MKYFLACFCFVATFAAFEALKMIGPVGTIIANSISACKEKPPGDEIDLQIDLKSIDEKGTKAMFANFTNKIPIDETIDYNLVIQKWESGGWKNFYNVKGKLCVDAQKLLPKVWQKLRSTAKPAIPLPCPIKPERYVIDKFQTSTKDMTIPAIFYGRILVKLTVFKNKKLILCAQGEGVSQAP